PPLRAPAPPPVIHPAATVVDRSPSWGYGPDYASGAGLSSAPGHLPRRSRPRMRTTPDVDNAGCGQRRMWTTPDVDNAGCGQRRIWTTTERARLWLTSLIV